MMLSRLPLLSQSRARAARRDTCTLNSVKSCPQVLDTFRLAVNLFPEPVPALRAGYAPPTIGKGTVTLSALVRNNGNTATTTPTTVTFYADSAYQKPIGSAVIPAGLGGCMTSVASVTTTWTDLAVGRYPYWVYVDSDKKLAESDEDDNVTSGIAEIFAHRTMLPVLRR